MEERLDRLENMLTALGIQVAAGFGAADQRLERMDQRLENMDQRLDEVRAHLTLQIDSVRDDIRIFAEAHVALEQRTTALEQRRR
jgi:hypothetical protein